MSPTDRLLRLKSVRDFLTEERKWHGKREWRSRQCEEAIRTLDDVILADMAEAIAMVAA